MLFNGGHCELSRHASKEIIMCAFRLIVANVAIVALVMAGVVSADEGKLPPPGFRASLVCFNGKDGSGSNCRVTMAKIDGGLKVVTGKLRCGFKGAASEIEWTYRGQKDGKDLYHVVRKFPLGSKDAITSEADVSFDGKRQVIFEDQAQCIVIEVQPAGK
jgi:hypothetical protein